ncbi:protein SOC2 [Plasmodium yoelii yoelii]|uniref:Protein SOC2 n=1 Tax=Plasmodium yoelii yoelii TaxID=73239 RepID=A0AAE9WS30_PLAYO|nr:protein SOC2 [Plasmodium yoelii yoelii]
MYNNSQNGQHINIFIKRKKRNFKEAITINNLLSTLNKYIWNIRKINENSSMNENMPLIKWNTDDNSLEKGSIHEKKCKYT